MFKPQNRNIYQCSLYYANTKIMCKLTEIINFITAKLVKFIIWLINWNISTQ